MIVCVFIIGVVVGIVLGTVILFYGIRSIVNEKEETIKELKNALSDIALLRNSKASIIALEALRHDDE